MGMKTDREEALTQSDTERIVLLLKELSTVQVDEFLRIIFQQELQESLLHPHASPLVVS